MFITAGCYCSISRGTLRIRFIRAWLSCWARCSASAEQQPRTAGLMNDQCCACRHKCRSRD